MKGEGKEERHCMRCGKEFTPGGLNYLVNIRIFSGFDGFLLEPEEGVDQRLDRLMKEVEEMDPEELEKEVYEEFTLVLCKSCRDRFAEEARHPWGGPFQVLKDPGKILH